MKTLTKTITVKFKYWGPFGDYCITPIGMVFHKSLLETEDATTIEQKIQQGGLIVATEELMEHYKNHGHLGLYNWSNAFEKAFESREAVERILGSGDLSRIVNCNIIHNRLAYDVSGNPIKRAFYFDDVATHVYLQEINRYRDALKEIMDHLKDHPQIKNLTLKNVFHMNQRREGTDEQTPEFSFIPTDEQWTELMKYQTDDSYVQRQMIFEFLGIKDIVSKYEKISD